MDPKEIIKKITELNKARLADGKKAAEYITILDRTIPIKPLLAWLRVSDSVTWEAGINTGRYTYDHYSDRRVDLDDCPCLTLHDGPSISRFNVTDKGNEYNTMAWEDWVMPVIPWLMKAAYKDNKDAWKVERFSKVYGGISTDGIRMHIMNNLPIPETPFDWKSILDGAKKNQNTIILDATGSKSLLEQAKLAKKHKSSKIVLNINGKLDVSFGDWETEYTATIEGQYLHEGADIKIVVNPAFLVDLLDKGDRDTWMAFKDSSYAIYYTDCLNREAVLMPMRAE